MHDYAIRILEPQVTTTLCAQSETIAALNEDSNAC